MTIDRNALADDLAALGLKALSSAARKGTIDTERLMKSVERLRDQLRNRGDQERAEQAQQVLNRWWGKGESG